MTLMEMSVRYADTATLIRARITELKQAEQEQEDPELARRLRIRISALTPLLRETRELAALTAHYYDRSYHNNERYTL